MWSYGTAPRSWWSSFMSSHCTTCSCTETASKLSDPRWCPKTLWNPFTHALHSFVGRSSTIIDFGTFMICFSLSLVCILPARLWFLWLPRDLSLILFSVVDDLQSSCSCFSWLLNRCHLTWKTSHTATFLVCINVGVVHSSNDYHLPSPHSSITIFLKSESRKIGNIEIIREKIGFWIF